MKTQGFFLVRPHKMDPTWLPNPTQLNPYNLNSFFRATMALVGLEILNSRSWVGLKIPQTQPTLPIHIPTYLNSIKKAKKQFFIIKNFLIRN